MFNEISKRHNIPKLAHNFSIEQVVKVRIFTIPRKIKFSNYNVSNDTNLSSKIKDQTYEALLE